MISLTSDYVSIWTYCKLLKRVFGTNIRTPVQLYEELTLAMPAHKLANCQVIHVDLDAFLHFSVKEIGLPCSIGIAGSKLVAKIGCDSSIAIQQVLQHGAWHSNYLLTIRGVPLVQQA